MFRANKKHNNTNKKYEKTLNEANCSIEKEEYIYIYIKFSVTSLSNFVSLSSTIYYYQTKK